MPWNKPASWYTQAAAPGAVPYPFSLSDLVVLNLNIAGFPRKISLSHKKKKFKIFLKKE